MSIEFLRQQVNKIKSRYELAHAQLRSETKNLQIAEQHLEDIKEAQHITQTVAQTIQQQAHSKIAKVVTACLQSVFRDMDYEFKLKFERERNRTEAQPVIIKDGHEVGNILDSESGGVIDVAAFALQLSAILLHKPALRKILILDEPFKFVSIEYRSNISRMIEKLAKDFDVQFILVSHQEEMSCGKQVLLS